MFKLVVAEDFGWDNGELCFGSFPSVEEAMEALEGNYPQCFYAGARIIDDTKIVAESNGSWGNHVMEWHCPLH